MNIRLLLNRWVILGALLLAGLLVLITAVSIGLTSARQNDEVGFVPADLTMIPAPTSTSSAPATATIDPFAPTPAPTGIAIGNYVQITGTEGEGLRIEAESPYWIQTDGEPRGSTQRTEIHVRSRALRMLMPPRGMKLLKNASLKEVNEYSPVA